MAEFEQPTREEPLFCCASSVHIPAPEKPGVPELQDAKNYFTFLYLLT